MQTVNIHHAKTHLSRLIEEAAKGETFIIAKAGKPMVKVTALDAPEIAQRQRLGFLAGSCSIPENFDAMASPEIARLFGAEE